MNFDNIEINAVEVVNINDGDILAVYIKNRLRDAQREEIKSTLKEAFNGAGKTVPIIILEGEEIKLQVIRTENDDT